jgi:hypothetical protein
VRAAWRASAIVGSVGNRAVNMGDGRLAATKKKTGGVKRDAA